MTPKWPDFEIERVKTEDMDFVKGTTDTGRPKTPLFSVCTTVMDLGDIDTIPEDILRKRVEQHFLASYNRAHPNGCPGSH